MFSYLGRSCTPTISKKIKNANAKSEKNRIIFEMWGRMSPWVRQKLKRHRKSRFQIEMKLLSKAQLQSVSIKKVTIFFRGTGELVLLDRDSRKPWIFALELRFSETFCRVPIC